MHSELITIGIPVYNMEKSILMAINSCLKQSYKNLEILIVDDGSSDNSIKVIKQNISDSRVRIYQRQQNGGVCAAMQDLVVQAKGEYICFLDADDTMMSTRVEKQYRAIKSAEKKYPSRMIASFCGSEVNDITAGEKYRIDPNDLWNISAKHSFGGGTGHSMYRVADLKKLSREEVKNLRKVLRPWGAYETIEEGQFFKVKRIYVSPHQALSLQRHKFRSEHWVVVQGRATVKCGDKEFQLHKNQSTFIPQFEIHRLSNQTNEDLIVIEVQSGEYLSENDIERLDDIYGRV